MNCVSHVWTWDVLCPVWQAVTSGYAARVLHLSVKLESWLTERSTAACVGGVLVASFNLGKLLLQYPPFWFQHWSSKLLGVFHDAGDRQL